jgi:hypothetical protein
MKTKDYPACIIPDIGISQGTTSVVNVAEMQSADEGNFLRLPLERSERNVKTSAF